MRKTQIQKSIGLLDQLNNFLNNSAITFIPPILASGKTISSIVEKANLFGRLFTSQCATLQNEKKLPLLLMKTYKPLNTFKKGDISSIIKSLNLRKAHGIGNISDCIFQLCRDSVIISLTLIFNFFLGQIRFPDTWKMASIIPVHRKEVKNLEKNYKSTYFSGFLKDYHLFL